MDATSISAYMNYCVENHPGQSQNLLYGTANASLRRPTISTYLVKNTLINLSSAQLRKFHTCPKLYAHSTFGNSRIPKTKSHGILHHIHNFYSHTCISHPTSTMFTVTLFRNAAEYGSNSNFSGNNFNQDPKTKNTWVYPSTLSREQDKAWSRGLIAVVITKQRYAR